MATEKSVCYTTVLTLYDIFQKNISNSIFGVVLYVFLSLLSAEKANFNYNYFHYIKKLMLCFDGFPNKLSEKFRFNSNEKDFYANIFALNVNILINF